jgi:DNA-binding response OmpR family regulator
MSHPATASLRIHHTSAAPLLRSVTGTGGDLTSRAADAGVTLEGPLEMGGLAVDLGGYVVTLDGVQVDLSPRQVELLALFLAAPRKVWSRDLLHWVAWGDTSPSRRVDVQLCRLRTRTGLDLFRNVRDRGWALRPVS